MARKAKKYQTGGPVDRLPDYSSENIEDRRMESGGIDPFTLFARAAGQRAARSGSLPRNYSPPSSGLARELGAEDIARGPETYRFSYLGGGAVTSAPPRIKPKSNQHDYSKNAKR